MFFIVYYSMVLFNSQSPQKKWIFELCCTLMFRSKSLALHAVRTQSINSDSSPEGEGLVDLSTELNVCEASPSPETGPVPSTLQENHKDPTKNQPDTSPNSEGQKAAVGDPREGDRLWIHLRDNMKEIKTFCAEMIKLIPIPEHCVIEGKPSNLRTIHTVTCSKIPHIQV